MSYESAYGEILVPGVGRETFDATRKAVESLAGEFTASEVISKACSIRGSVDCWHVLNSLDQLVTLGELRELTNRDEVLGQHRRYVRGGG